MRTYTYNILNKKSKREKHFFTKIIFQEKSTRRKFDFLLLGVTSDKKSEINFFHLKYIFLIMENHATDSHWRTALSFGCGCNGGYELVNFGTGTSG